MNKYVILLYGPHNAKMQFEGIQLKKETLQEICNAMYSYVANIVNDYPPRSDGKPDRKIKPENVWVEDNCILWLFTQPNLKRPSRFQGANSFGSHVKKIINDTINEHEDGEYMLEDDKEILNSYKSENNLK